MRPVARSRSLAPLGAATGGSTTWASSVVTRIERRLRHPIPARCADRSVGLLAPVRPRARPQPRRPRSPGDVVDGGVRARRRARARGLPRRRALLPAVEPSRRRRPAARAGEGGRAPRGASGPAPGLRPRPAGRRARPVGGRPARRPALLPPRRGDRARPSSSRRTIRCPTSAARPAAARSPRRRGPSAGHLPQRVGAAGPRRALRRARRPRPGDPARRLPVPVRRARRPGAGPGIGAAGRPSRASCGRTRAPTSSSGPGRPSAISSQERRSSSPAGR